MALAPVRPFRAWDFGDNVGIRVAFEKAPHKDHPDWTESALRYLGVRHVRTNATSPASVTTIKRLHDRLGIRFHFTAIKPPTSANEATTREFARKRAAWIIANGLKGLTTSVESMNEWDDKGAPSLWMNQLRWAQDELWDVVRAQLRS